MTGLQADALSGRCNPSGRSGANQINQRFNQPKETLMAKMNNNPKMNTKAKNKRTKGRRAGRTMALGIAEPRLRGPRNTGSLNTTEQGHAGPSAHTPLPAQIFGIMLDWSPWVIMLRQQALLAQVLSRMIEAQQQYARIGRLPARQAARVDQR